MRNIASAAERGPIDMNVKNTKLGTWNSAIEQSLPERQKDFPASCSLLALLRGKSVGKPKG
jgi:hypothetical protein